MSKYQKLYEDFKSGAVRIVVETGKPIARVARDLGVNEGTLGSWVAKARRERDGGGTSLSEDEPAELVRLRRENTELRKLGVPPACGGGTSSNARWPSG